MQEATPISYYLTFFYVDYLVRRGLFKELLLEDLPPLPDTFAAKRWREKYCNTKSGRTVWKLLALVKASIFGYTPWNSY
jgi:hypothetical protein